MLRETLRAPAVSPVRRAPDAATVAAASKLHLQAGENVVIALHPSGWALSGLYFWTLGLYHFWRKAKVFAVTDQRILTKKGIINKNERNLPLIYVQDASVTRSLGMGNVSVSTAGGGEGLSRSVR